MLNKFSEVSLGEMVKLLAAKLHQEEVALPFKNQKPWHMLFYALKSQQVGSDKPHFLDDLVFDWDAPYPRCEELSEFLNALHVTANVSAHNPHFDVISVNDADADRWLAGIGDMDTSSSSFLQHATNLARLKFCSALG
jgi:hypothetical protein